MGKSNNNDSIKNRWVKEIRDGKEIYVFNPDFPNEPIKNGWTKKIRDGKEVYVTTSPTDSCKPCKKTKND